MSASIDTIIAEPDKNAAAVAILATYKQDDTAVEQSTSAALKGLASLQALRHTDVADRTEKELFDEYGLDAYTFMWMSYVLYGQANYRAALERPRFSAHATVSQHVMPLAIETGDKLRKVRTQLQKDLFEVSKYVVTLEKRNDAAKRALSGEKADAEALAGVEHTARPGKKKHALAVRHLRVGTTAPLQALRAIEASELPENVHTRGVQAAVFDGLFEDWINFENIKTASLEDSFQLMLALEEFLADVSKHHATLDDSKVRDQMSSLGPLLWHYVQSGDAAALDNIVQHRFFREKRDDGSKLFPALTVARAGIAQLRKSLPAGYPPSDRLALYEQRLDSLQGRVNDARTARAAAGTADATPVDIAETLDTPTLSDGTAAAAAASTAEQPVVPDATSGAPNDVTIRVNNSASVDSSVSNSASTTVTTNTETATVPEASGDAETAGDESGKEEQDDSGRINWLLKIAAICLGALILIVGIYMAVTGASGSKQVGKVIGGPSGPPSTLAKQASSSNAGALPGK